MGFISKDWIGAYIDREGMTTFTVWAPFRKSVELELLDNYQIIKMDKKEEGYFQVQVSQLKDGDKYFYILDGKDKWPDPASFSNPDGVHGASALVNHHSYQWKYSSSRRESFKEWIIYEVHVGTFSEKENFQGVIDKISYLKSFGFNAIEIMPISQFPGKRNWGYDGVYPFSVQNSYGGVNEFKRLIDECHKENISVILDVVYNHLGPEGNYFWQYGPYFTDKYKTPWGEAINYDSGHSDSVRNLIIKNALYWSKFFEIDGLRLDAIHAIWDRSATHILEEIKINLERERQKSLILIAESDLNDPRIITDREKGGYGLNGQWSDDLHHSLHSYLTKEKKFYYQDYGDRSLIKKGLLDGFVYDGQYSVFRKKSYGKQLKKGQNKQLVVSLQNHDQIGNRAFGERLSVLLPIEKYKWAYTLTMLSSYIPLIFMGDETLQKNPFHYFIDHSDKNLIKAVKEGRKKEFEGMFGTEEYNIDPKDENTFIKSKINWEEKDELFTAFFRQLMRVRKRDINEITNYKNQQIKDYNEYWVWIRNYETLEVVMMISFEESVSFNLLVEGNLKVIFDTDDKEFSNRSTQVQKNIKLNDEIRLYPFQIICAVKGLV